MANKFSAGDYVKDWHFNMKVVKVIEEDGKWFYECEPADFDAPFNRIIPEELLKSIIED